jgi:hypothetical protein
MQKKVLMVFDDPGGGLAVSSLIESIIKNKIKIEIYSGKLSEKFLRKGNPVHKKIDSMITREQAAVIIDKTKPDLLVTGTGGGNAEQELRNVAFEKNIKSIVILDFWKDYGRRWLYASYSLAEMKDSICVMDDLTKDEMISENFREENILVKIFNSKERSPKQNIFKVNHILFLSQPLHIIGLKDYKIHPLKRILDSIKRLAIENHSEYTLNIKLHPSEEMSSDIIDLKNSYNSELLKINFADKSISPVNFISEAETVIGYNTIAMFESRAMNKRTLSLNISTMKNSLIKAMETAGIEIIEPEQDIIYDRLVRKKAEFKNEKVFTGGIQNCIKLIQQELNLN